VAIVEINNVVVVIAGGNSGLGAATAQILAEKGAKIAILDRQIDNATNLVKQFAGIAIECDVTDESRVDTAIDQITEVLGDIRVGVNCAGIAPAKRIVGKQGTMPLADFTKVINVNLIGTFNVMRACVAKMAYLNPVNEDGERGVIINTASIAAFEGQIGQTAYSASKGAVASMTLPAARELARFGIRVVGLAPGVFATPMVLNMPLEVQQSLGASVPFPKRLGNPNEFGKLAAHVIENNMLNGCVLRIDGAMRMNEK